MLNNKQLEMAILGALVRDNGEGIEKFQAADFQYLFGRDIYRALVELKAGGGDWGFPQFCAKVPKPVWLQASEAMESACLKAEMDRYASELRRQAQLRALRTAALELTRVDPNSDPDEVAKRAIERFQAIPTRKENALGGLKSLSEIMAMHDLVGDGPEVRTGIGRLDDEAHIGGGSLNVIAARPGGGKSAMMLDWSVSAAKSGYQVLFFSLEMSLKDIRRRLWAMFPDGSATAPVWIQEPPQRKPPVGHLVAMAAEFCRMLRDRPTMIVVDYIQILAPNRYWNTRREQVGEVVRELKAMAMSLDVPVLAGAQLSRAVEQRGPKSHPQLADLKEAGEIEEVADLVCLLHRKYDTTEVMLGVAKNRHGHGNFSIPLEFLPASARFVEKGRIERDDWQ